MTDPRYHDSLGPTDAGPTDAGPTDAGQNGAGQDAASRDDAPSGADGRLHAPATQRNRGPILEVLMRLLPSDGTVLEIASGTGEHAAWFAQHLRPLVWQPSDADPEMRASIDAHARAQGVRTIQPAIELDVRRAPWPVRHADAVVCINLIHIAPWAAAQGLFQGAAALLPAGAPLLLYGPFKRGGQHTADSNASFDVSLRANDPSWGVRDLDDVDALAASHGFQPSEVVAMPANNLTVAYLKA
jgi:SAM-dependent methyltransferase